MFFEPVSYVCGTWQPDWLLDFCPIFFWIRGTRYHDRFLTSMNLKEFSHGQLMSKNRCSPGTVVHRSRESNWHSKVNEIIGAYADQENLDKASVFPHSSSSCPCVFRGHCQMITISILMSHRLWHDYRKHKQIGPSAIRYPWWVHSFETWGETSLEQTEKRSYESRKKSPLKKVCLRDFFLSIPWEGPDLPITGNLMDGRSKLWTCVLLPSTGNPTVLFIFRSARGVLFSMVKPRIRQCSKMSEARQKCFNMDLFNQPLEDLDQSESNKKRCPNQCIYIIWFWACNQPMVFICCKGSKRNHRSDLVQDYNLIGSRSTIPPMEVGTHV